MAEKPNTPKDNSGSDKPVIKPEYTEFSNPENSEIHIKELNGFIEMVSSAPTSKARRLWEQLKMHTNGTIYVYDNESGTWLTVQGGFAGAFDSAGDAGSPFPTGWTVSRTGTGNYLITHNLGTTEYSVVATPLGTYNIVQVASRNSNTFELYSVDRATGNVSNTGMNFVLTLA